MARRTETQGGVVGAQPRRRSSPSVIRYVALLRGVNMHGSGAIKMDKLRRVFRRMGFRNVATVGASGNIVFDAAGRSASKLRRAIEAELESVLGAEVVALVRAQRQLLSMGNADPFGGRLTKHETFGTVTFLAGSPRGLPRLPHVSPQRDFTVVNASAREVFSVVRVAKPQRAGLLACMEKTLGRAVTTRRWSTVCKLMNA
ncbi:MAG TPA: DUF1697 domain-containing protein [Gemmatimonadaceae bacterium]